MLVIGIDNGTTGSIAILTRKGKVRLHIPTPTKKELSYTKSSQWITRINSVQLNQVLKKYATEKDKHCICFLERPLTSPHYKAVVSGMRALEATLVVLETLDIRYRYIDSKEWQSHFLPKDIKKDKLKKAGIDIARRNFPKTVGKMKERKIKDADALLIAEYARIKFR